jgi:hypothetical protein
MCLLDETVWHLSALMALGALLIMLINCWQTRMNKKHAAEIQEIRATEVRRQCAEICMLAGRDLLGHPELLAACMLSAKVPEEQ